MSLEIACLLVVIKSQQKWSARLVAWLFLLKNQFRTKDGNILLDEIDLRQSPSEINLAADHELYHFPIQDNQQFHLNNQHNQNLLGVKVVDGVVQFDKTDEILSYYRKFILTSKPTTRDMGNCKLQDNDVEDVASKFPWVQTI